MSNRTVQKATGMTVEVYKPSFGDCSNEGLSARFNTLTDVDDKSQPDAIEIQEWYGYYRAVPRGNTKWSMFGGCYVTTSDSRWKERYPHPIPLHDRYEGN